MTSVLDLWRAVDPDARLVSGSIDHLARPVRGVVRTRTGPPHLPAVASGEVLIVDGAILVGGSLDAIIGALLEVAGAPVALWVTGTGGAAPVEPAGAEIPVLLGVGSVPSLMAAAERHLDDEVAQLTAVAAGLRLAGAEAALADPQPSAPAGVLATRLHRGVAITVDGALQALHPRPAGRALATRFAAAHARLLVNRTAASAAARRTQDGLWVLERSIGPRASAWLFDDLPLARIDHVGLDALAITLRALLRRPAESSGARRTPKTAPSTGDPMRDTLMAVARANGRIAPAARSLGVHRNTVLYRLRRASDDLGIDPRRPDDAIRLLRGSDPTE
ncbi:MAG: helix-turn-helix domain-containing protein [Candidatus Limnocylindria bacterium]